MNVLKRAAAREQLLPFIWWMGIAMAMWLLLLVLMFHHSMAGFVVIAIAGPLGWAVPLVLTRALSAPQRAKVPAPLPGHGRYRDWVRQVSLLGRVLMYHEDNPDLPRDLRHRLHATREDMGGLLRAHSPLEDLVQLCEDVRQGILPELKQTFWGHFRSRVRDLRVQYERELAGGMEPDCQLACLQEAVEGAAALATRYCIPRMLERERLYCAHACAWLAAHGSRGVHADLSPIDLAAALVVEWCDFSEPWLPAIVLQRAVTRLKESAQADAAELAQAAAAAAAATSAPPEECPGAPAAALPAKRVKVRVRVKRRSGHRRHCRHYRGPGMWDIMLSFIQWLRYSVRSWLLYRG